MYRLGEPLKGRRPWRRTRMIAAAAALCWAASSGVATAVPPQPDDIYQTDGADPVTPGGTTGCPAENTWSNPRVTMVVHTGGFTMDVGSLLGAVNDVVAEFNRVGGTSASVGRVVTSTVPFNLVVQEHDASPTIHVGATYQPQLTATGEDPDPSGQAWRFPDSRGCIASVNIGMRNDMAWDLGTPPLTDPTVLEKGDVYYDAIAEPATGMYFRPVFLHEVLHAFGLDHSRETYSLMNYSGNPSDPTDPGSYPWANRVPARMVRPLSADVRTLRALYPSSASTRSEVAALTTWFEAVPNTWAVPLMDPATDPPAVQATLCAPSTGDSWSTELFGDNCGEQRGDPPTNVVCMDDVLRARFALANYSTSDVEVTARLWFSLDEQWGPDDAVSPTVRSFSVGQAGSTLSGNTWAVPALGYLVGQQEIRTFYPIIRVEATTGDGTVVRDWIPLPGLVVHPGTCPPETSVTPAHL